MRLGAYQSFFKLARITISRCAEVAATKQERDALLCTGRPLHLVYRSYIADGRKACGNAP
jgi:hypothetical protein